LAMHQRNDNNTNATCFTLVQHLHRSDPDLVWCASIKLDSDAMAARRHSPALTLTLLVAVTLVEVHNPSKVDAELALAVEPAVRCQRVHNERVRRRDGSDDGQPAIIMRLAHSGLSRAAPLRALATDHPACCRSLRRCRHCCVGIRYHRLCAGELPVQVDLISHCVSTPVDVLRDREPVFVGHAPTTTCTLYLPPASTRLASRQRRRHRWRFGCSLLLLLQPLPLVAGQRQDLFLRQRVLLPAREDVRPLPRGALEHAGTVGARPRYQRRLCFVALHRTANRSSASMGARRNAALVSSGRPASEPKRVFEIGRNHMQQQHDASSITFRRFAASS
jgi:hypothetical protein